MALGLAMALVVCVAQLLVMVTHQRSLARQYSIATRELGNAMEEAVSRPWDETTSEALTAVNLSEACNAYLPEASIAVDVAEENPGLRRITIQIEWQSAPERARQSVRLVGWRFRTEEGES